MKRIRIIILSSILFLWFGQLAHSQTHSDKKKNNSIDFSLVTALDLAYEFKGEKIQKTEFIIKPEVTFRFGRKSKLVFKGRIYNEFSDFFEKGKPSESTLSNFSKRAFIGNTTDLELRELYYFINLGKNLDISLGKQQIVWGETDGLKLLDVVNPQNFREFVLDEFEDSRIPLWSLKSNIKLESLNLQVVWVPDNSYHITQGFDAPFFPRSLFPKPPQGIAIQNNPIKDKPSNFISDSDIGLKASWFKNGWDISLNYFYHYNDLPVFYNELIFSTEGDPVIEITPQYKRTHLIGGTFNKVIGLFTLRGEVAYLTNQYFSSISPESLRGNVKSDQFKSAIGLDYIKGETVLSTQLFTDYLIDNVSAFLPRRQAGNRNQLETNISFLASQEMMNDNLKAEILWVHNTNHSDGFIRPKLNYWLKSNVQIHLRTDLFYGNKNHLFGQFRVRNRLSFGIEWGI